MMFGWGCKNFLCSEGELCVRMKKEMGSMAPGTLQPAEPIPCHKMQDMQQFFICFKRSY